MRFRFCGDLDCPDWVLAGINLLSRLSSLRLRSLCSAVADSLLSTPLSMLQLQKVTADAKLNSSELRASVSVVSFILESAVKHHVEVPELEQELQQLGLPREHASSLGRVLGKNSGALLDELRERTLRYPGLLRVEWDVLAVKDSLNPDEAQPEVQLAVETTGEGKVCLAMDLTTAEVVRRELMLARQRMGDVS